LVFAPFPLSM